MELNVFAGQEKSELSMIEVARAILEERGRDNEMYFNDLVNEIQNYLEKSNSEIRAALPTFYSDLNVDGSFIPLGENKWGLRSWYAIDEIDEEVITLEEDDEDAPKRKKKRVNAFMDGDDDAIDYGHDDPEDEDTIQVVYHQNTMMKIQMTKKMKLSPMIQKSTKLSQMTNWMKRMLI
ncbi:DNA-directed RNA polymerase delta subunit [Streptococcus suis GZ1]|uniref:Probable DNA-directed RNA polymerase subunit delta n=1 Tax=Streptococcus suis (strain GZ1) TaxID=423211 RepID=D5AG07_STRGZ|nr:DNA-directed RNA polymerase delta subunit [Streptococcus suis GZ1]